MERLANEPPSPPPGRLAKWQRRWNKLHGRPATADVGVLASLLVALKSVAAEALAAQLAPDIAIDRVAVTMPSIPALTAEETLADALEHAGLRPWLGDTRYQPRAVAQPRAVLAGHGQGLCADYADVFLCRGQAGDLPVRRALFVSLTRHALYVTLERVQDAFPAHGSSEQRGTRVLDFEGGLDRREGFESEGGYWAYVRGRIVGLVREREGEGQRRPVDMVLLGGENATDGGFLATLRDALAELHPTLPSLVGSDIDEAMVLDPLYAAARGMAVYARRRQEVPGDCIEGPGCDEVRERERREGRGRKLEL